MSKQNVNTIGGFVRNEILTTEKSNEQILKAVHKTFPTAKTTMACIAWYKSDMRKKGLIGGGRTQVRLERIKAELKFLKDQTAIKNKIKELESQLKELTVEKTEA